MTWREDAACRGMSVNRFVFDTTNAASLVAAAKSVCATCPAYCREQCLGEEMARMHREPVPTIGVYGGLDQRERIALLDQGRHTRRHGPIVRRPGSSVLEDRRQERNRKQNERREREGRPDKAKEWSKRWLKRLRHAAHAESWALRRELWAEQQAGA